jgi:hypothetical protein
LRTALKILKPIYFLKPITNKVCIKGFRAWIGQNYWANQTL